MNNTISFKVSGRYALFTDPLTKTGGEKFSYQIPTYQALKGITESCYWKPTIIWVIDRIRVMKAIKTQSKAVKPLKYGGGNYLSIYTYLADVEYQVEAHFEWNLYREDLKNDRNENKHFFVAKRMIERGGRRDVFLGARECQAYLEPCIFGEEKSFYDDYGDINFNLMFHGFNYPDEVGSQTLEARFWQPVMKNGLIEFVRPNECTTKKYIKPMLAKKIITVGLEEEDLLAGYEEVE